MGRWYLVTTGAGVDGEIASRSVVTALLGGPLGNRRRALCQKSMCSEPGSAYMHPSLCDPSHESRYYTSLGLVKVDVCLYSGVR